MKHPGAGVEAALGVSFCCQAGQLHSFTPSLRTPFALLSDLFSGQTIAFFLSAVLFQFSSADQEVSPDA